MKKQTITYKGVKQTPTRKLSPVDKVRQAMFKINFEKLKASGYKEITTKQGTYLIDSLNKGGLVLRKDGTPAAPGLLTLFTGQRLIVGQGGVILEIVVIK